MSDQQQRLTVASWNIWDLYLVSKHRKKRISAIIDHVKQRPSDILLLQELWITADFETMQRQWLGIYPYSRFFQEGILGAGLAIFSRHPILSSHLTVFPTNGSPWRLTNGDWYSGKGVGMVVVEVEDRMVAVFNLHAHAEYGRERRARLGTRIAQLWEARHLIDSMCCNFDAVIVGGDFNTLPDELPYKAFFKEDLGCSKHLEDLGALGNQPTEGVNEYANRHPKRIDYIFTHHIKCTAFRTENIMDASNKMSLSDHAMITAELQLDLGECDPCQRRTAASYHHQINMDIRMELLVELRRDLRKRRTQALAFLLVWIGLLLASIGFGAYSIVTVYISGFPRTISLLLYVLFPLVVIVSDYFFFLWMFARGDVRVYERILHEI